MSSTVSLVGFFILCFGAASSGAMFRPGAWYEALKKPSWTPPNWMFPVVWTILFVMMAFSGWLIWEAQKMAAWPILALYVGHLVLNAGWSFLFFKQRRLDWALFEVAVLWLSILAMIVLFAPISQLASLLLVPYIVWVTIAAALNFRLVQLNGPRGIS